MKEELRNIKIICAMLETFLALTDFFFTPYHLSYILFFNCTSSLALCAIHARFLGNVKWKVGFTGTSFAPYLYV